MSYHTDARIVVIFIKYSANVMAVQGNLEMVCSHQTGVVVQVVVNKNTPLFIGQVFRTLYLNF